MSGKVHEAEPAYDEFTHASSQCIYPSIPVEAKKKKKKKNQTAHGIDDVQVDETKNFDEEWASFKLEHNLIDEDRNQRLYEAIKELRISTIKSREARKKQEELDEQKRQEQKLRELQQEEQKRQELQQEERKQQELQKEEKLRQQRIESNERMNTERSPPIYVYNVETTELKNICEFAVGTNFFLDLMCKDGIMVHCHTMEQYETIQKILELSKKEFSLTTRENIYRRMALYGLDPSTPTIELLNILKQHECDHLKFINVKFFRTRRGPAYLVNISFDSRVDLLDNIDIINNQLVSWEAYILQCYNCQEFGHRGSRCRFEPQCVKCARNHLSSECHIKKEGFIDKRFKCAVCNNAGHTADSTECPWFQYKQEHHKYKGQPLSTKSEQDVNTNASETKCDKELREFMCTMAEQMNNISAQMQSMTNQMERICCEVGKRWLKNPQSND